MTSKNAVPLLRADGNLYFVDVEKGILVAAIASPVMYDAKEAESYEIAVELKQTGEGRYVYTLTPDRGFLEDKARVYPVKIDPSVNTASGQIADTFITSRYSNNNYVNDANLKVGYGSDLKVSRGLIRINQFPGVLSGAQITEASYHAYQNYSGSSSPGMDVVQITSD